MKKIALTSFIASVLLSSAFATTADYTNPANPAVLPTKDYVDDGLYHVYSVKADKTSVYTKEQVYNKDEVYNKDQVYNKDEVYNKNEIYTKQEADGKYITGGDGLGITVNNHQVGLNVDAQEGAMYVYTRTGWRALGVEDAWDSGVVVVPEPEFEPEGD